MEKKEIRKVVFGRRREADPRKMLADSEIICKKVMETEAFQNASAVYVYMDCKGEVCIRPLLETAWRLGKKTAAPRVTGPGEMRYYYISSYDDLAPGYYQIPEPVTQEEAHDETALLIVPGVAFDKNRHRCGYGQGFYDRYLAAHTSHPTIALAFDFQIMEEVPADAFDRLPQILITEKEVFQ
ncbi:MAG: 5-formyltetrahydrofolate cyclo-ligase [Marvinbryantia sp.]|uniref:5-formyltetrahydrofolate cyclo-ligase n=2 Tax=Marvinbryantia sp. TaxID=2496532 RepID=UPI0025E043D4|nr:5-formyltetrahydrofolate cyclo-ligase [uncultured Marvinbryantia sp.]